MPGCAARNGHLRVTAAAPVVTRGQPSPKAQPGPLGAGFSTAERSSPPRGAANCLWGPSVTQSVFQLVEPGPCCVKFPPGLGGCIMNGEFNPYAADSFTLNSSAGGSPGTFDVPQASQPFYEMFYALSAPLPTRPSPFLLKE